MAIETPFPTASALLNQRIADWQALLKSQENIADDIENKTTDLRNQWVREEDELADLPDEKVQHYKRASDALRTNLVCQLLFKQTYITSLLQQIARLKNNLLIATPPSLDLSSTPISTTQMLLDSLETRANLAIAKISSSESLAWTTICSSLKGRPTAISQMTQTLSNMISLGSNADPTKVTAIYLALQPLLDNDSSHDAKTLSEHMIKTWTDRNQRLEKFNTEFSKALGQLTLLEKDTSNTTPEHEQKKQSLRNHITHSIVFCPEDQEDFRKEIASVQEALTSILPLSKPVDIKTDAADDTYTLATADPNAHSSLTHLLDRISTIASKLLLYRQRTDELVQTAYPLVIPASKQTSLARVYEVASSWWHGTPSTFEVEQRAAWHQAFHELLVVQK